MGPFYSKLLQHFFLSFASASAYWWVFLLFLFFLFSPSNPVDLPPAHQLHLHWPAVRRTHWHSRASVCAEADVYSTTQGSGLLHYTRITLINVFSVVSSVSQRAESPRFFSSTFTHRMRKDALETPIAQNGTGWNLAFRSKWVWILRIISFSGRFDESSPYENKC